MDILNKIKQFFYLDNRSEKELNEDMTDAGIWNQPVDKTYWNRTDFKSHEGLNIKKLCRKLDLMNNDDTTNKQQKTS